MSELVPLRSVPGGVTAAPDGFEVGYIGEDGAEHRINWADAWSVRFEWCRPVRRFAQYKGQRHFPGRWWTATAGGHIGFESWLERDHLMLLDFDPAVVAVSSQPFWLFWTNEQGKVRSHAPDYFARHADGGVLVLDCRPDERIKDREAAAFAATRLACEQFGWGYQVAGATDAIRTRNVRWLAGYRHPRHDLPAVSAALLEVFTIPGPLMAGAESVGDPIAVLPVLFHLLWRHALRTELSSPLHPDTVVVAAAPVVS